MDRNPWVSALVLLLHLTLYTSGEMIPQNLTLHIWEGNVTVTWDHPQENPGNYLYLVQLSNYIDSPSVWFNVSDCNLIKATICNIGNISRKSHFRVRVGVLTLQNDISWTSKRHINVGYSQLFPPTFTLSSTSNSVRVKIHRKPILDDLFPYGVQYTAYLWPEGQNSQTLIQSDEDTDDGEIIFVSLKSLQVYCVRVKVESKTDAQNISSERCIKLSLDVTLVICLISLGLFGLTVSLMFLICFLRRPGKLPSALKAINVWKPMIIKSDQVETITDKGWIIINNTDLKKCIEFTEEDIERRASLDSGVSIEQLLSVSNSKADGQDGDVQVDSGCGSLKGTEVSGGVRRDSIHEIHRGDKNEGTEDSGLGLSHHEVSGSLEGEDTGLLSQVVASDGYRSQSPSTVDVQNDMDSNMAAPSAGYRSGQVTCMCSEQEYCVWCKFKNPFTKNCPAVTQSQTDFRQTEDGSFGRSNYLKKSFIETVKLLNMEVPVTEPDLTDNNGMESSLTLFSTPLLLQNEKHDSIMHTGSFTLGNMELTFS